MFTVQQVRPAGRTHKKGRPVAALKTLALVARTQFDTSCVVLVSRIGW
jgi:hypothetical protein